MRSQVVACWLILPSVLAAQTVTVEADRSPHGQRFIVTATGVRLEILDWGGTGEPLVFLVGNGNTAHVYDDFAPRFNDRFRVVGITRRGFGASTQPPVTTDVSALVRDIVAVLDTLGILRASFVGHSFACDEMTRLAGMYPERVTRLVYLDAAYDRPALSALRARKHLTAPPDPRPMTAEDSASPAAFAAAFMRRSHISMPESEIRSGWRLDDRGRVVGKAASPIPAGVQCYAPESPDYTRVHAPALAIYALRRSARDLVTNYAELDSAGRAQADRFYDGGRYDAEQRANFKRSVRESCVVTIAGANHYVFLSHPDEVARAMRSFLAGSCPQ